MIKRKPVTSGLVGAAAVVAVLTLASRVVGFGRVAVLGQTFGDSCVGTAYTTANAVPNVVFEVVVGGALAGTVVPLLAGAASRTDTARVTAVVKALTGWVLLLLVPAALLCIAFSEPIVRLLLGDAAGCEQDVLVSTTASMLRVFAIQIPIYGLTVIAQGTLHAHRRFVAPALAPLLSSMVVIAVLLAYQGLSDNDGSLSALSTSALALLSWGTTLGVLVLLLTQWPSMGQLRLLFVLPSLRFPDSTGRPAVRLAAAGAVTVGAQWLAFVIGLRLANDNGEEGSALTFLLVWTVFLLPWAVLAFPIATSVFPQLSALYENNQPREFADTSATSLRAVVMAGALGAAGIVALASPLANVMLVGAPGVEDTSTLRVALQVSAGAVFGYALVGYLSRVLFARHSSRSAAMVAGGGWLVTALAAAVVVPQVSADDVVVAIAGCMSAGLLAAAVLALLLVKAAAGMSALNGLLRATAAAISAAVVAGAVGLLVVASLESLWSVTVDSWGGALVAGVLAGSMVVTTFALMVLLIDGDDLRTLWSALRQRRAAVSAE